MMRITNSSMFRNYNNRLGDNLSRLNDLSLKVSYSGRKYLNMSENPATAMRALQIRRSISKAESYKDNISQTNSMLTASLDNMNFILTQCHGISERYTEGMNSTSETKDKSIMADELRELQKNILQSLNAKFGDKYLFGGANTTEAPFEVNANGDLMYWDARISGYYAVKDYDPSNMLPDLTPPDEHSYIDIGIGVQLDSFGNILPHTAYDRAICGVDMIGSGSDNLYDTITQMINSLESGSNPDPDLLEQFFDARNNMTNMTAVLGTKDKYLEQSLNRLESDRLNLIDRQNDIEFDDSAEAIMNWQFQEYVYSLSLQMGASLLQPSLFSYLK